MNLNSSSRPILLVKGLRKQFGATKALNNLDFQLHLGEVHAVIGENGAGKSTFVKILSGAIKPDAGEMYIDGQLYQPSSPLDGLKHGLSIVYQELALAPHLSVMENILLGREPNRSGWLRLKVMKDRVDEALAAVNHPEIKPDTIVGNLGLGARQVVEIARALANEAKILVFDEPTSALSEEDSNRLFDLIRKLKSRNVAVIYISHFLEEVQKVSDNYTVLRDGQKVSSGAMTGATLDNLIEHMVGQRIEGMFPRLPHEIGQVVLAIDRLKGKAMAGPVSLTLKRGEILGLAGLVGSGRTEFLRTVFGLNPIEEGSIYLFGHEFRGKSAYSRINQGVGLLSEDRQGEGLALGCSVADNAVLSNFAVVSSRGIIDLKKQGSVVEKLIDRMKIKARGPWQRAAELSGGNQQKIAMARLLHQDASILLLDEPTRGIDVLSKSHVYQWVGELAQRGKSIIFVSSYFPELLGVCDRIAVFYRGSLLDIREVDRWDMSSLMAAATTGKMAANQDYAVS